MEVTRQLRKQEVKKLFKKTKRTKKISILLENVEYARNVASIFRTAEAGGVEKIYLTGISQKPPFGKDLRKASRSTEKMIPWEYIEGSRKVINRLKKEGYKIVAIELANNAVSNDQISNLIADTDKVCFVFGSEVFGVNKRTLEVCDGFVYMPMYGKVGSLNVGVSVGVVLYSF